MQAAERLNKNITIKTNTSPPHQSTSLSITIEVISINIIIGKEPVIYQ